MTLQGRRASFDTPAARGQPVRSLCDRTLRGRSWSERPGCPGWGEWVHGIVEW